MNNCKQNGFTWIKKYYEVFFLVFVFVMSSIPLFAHGFEYGVDTRFHLNRIEGILNEIKAHHFPVRISGYFMNGYGYPTSVFYGDILLYFPAFLRYIGFEVTNAYKAYIGFINVLTILISYFSFLRISGSKKASLLGTLAYSLSTVRLMDIYIRGAVGEYSAMAFLPLIMVGIWMMYDYDCNESKSKWKSAFPAFILAIGMSGVIETHIITTETVVIAVILISIVFFKTTFVWKVIKQYLLAVLFTLIINAWFIVPFVDYFLNENVLVTNSVAETEGIQFGGVYFYQFFMFFMYPYGSNTVDVNERLATIPGMLLTLGLIGVAILLVVYKVFPRLFSRCMFDFLPEMCVDKDVNNDRNKKDIRLISILLVVTLCILIISTNVFPWDFLSEHTGYLGKLLIQIQYPWRFLSVACVLMTCCIIMIFRMLNRKIARIVMYVAALISIITIAVFTVQYYHGANIVFYEDETSLWVDEVGMGEYLKVGNDRDSIVGMGNDILTENVISVETLEHRGCDYKIHVVTESNEGYVNMPVFNYKGYIVSDNYGNRYEIAETDNGRITFSVPANSDVEIAIHFSEPWYWRVAELVSLCALILSAVFVIQIMVINCKSRLSN